MLAVVQDYGGCNSLTIMVDHRISTTHDKLIVAIYLQGCNTLITAYICIYIYVNYNDNSFNMMVTHDTRTPTTSYCMIMGYITLVTIEIMILPCINIG